MYVDIDHITDFLTKIHCIKAILYSNLGLTRDFACEKQLDLV